MKLRTLLRTALLALLPLLAIPVAPSSASALRVISHRPPYGGRVPYGQPPVQAVRSVIQATRPQMEECAVQFEPPGSGLTRRLRTRVWLSPDGSWTLEMPGLRNDNQDHMQLRTCVETQIRPALQRIMRRFTGSRRIKVELTVPVTLPGPPPATAEVERLVGRQQRSLVGCMPGAGPQGNRAGEMLLRVAVAETGEMELAGLGVPDDFNFNAVAFCLGARLRAVRAARARASSQHEVRIRFRYTPQPTPPPLTPEQQAAQQAAAEQAAQQATAQAQQLQGAQQAALMAQLQQMQAQGATPQQLQQAAQAALQGGALVGLPTNPAVPTRATRRTGTLTARDRVVDGRHSDTHRFTFRRGDSITIDMISSDFDSYLYIDGPQGFTSSNDDGGQGLNSRLEFIAPADGSYSVRATSYSTGATGAYELIVQQPVHGRAAARPRR